MNADPSWNDLKIGFVRLGGLAWLAAAIWFAWYVRDHKTTGRPLPNGHGSFMTYGDGYLLDVVFLLMAVAWWLASRRLKREREPEAD